MRGGCGRGRGGVCGRGRGRGRGGVYERGAWQQRATCVHGGVRRADDVLDGGAGGLEQLLAGGVAVREKHQRQILHLHVAAAGVARHHIHHFRRHNACDDAMRL